MLRLLLTIFQIIFEDEILKKAERNHSKRIECQNCLNKEKNTQNLLFQKIIFIHLCKVRTGNNIIDFNVDPKNELNFDNIPKNININGKDYTLAFFHNYYNWSPCAHFTAIYNISSIDSHLEIDDLNPNRIKTRSNDEFYVNPKLLVYICNDD